MEAISVGMRRKTAETRVLVHFISEVEVTAFEIFFERTRFADFREEFFEFLTLKNGFIGNGCDGSVNADLGGRPLGKVEVGTP
jgi:hypothetical protein